ncbi:uncharacterized protein LOC116265674 [Nymphaea colorata]|uniref:uncharacterized protein LOC116265674 n=1 Tax=Nymphaea colorata TaxID=210225 RepID=UPI00129DE38C|nr:uncharacterized protein LOC116265674 [Nymphaea colorata]XP_031502321.1 uncharacterized protein LOC116265674 [Nymphaea colorata]
MMNLIRQNPSLKAIPFASLRRWLLPFSTAINGNHQCPSPPPSSSPLKGSSFSVLDYLTSSCGFPSDEALRISEKLGNSGCAETAVEIVNFLKASGFTDAHMKKLIGYYPKVLEAALEDDLKPKIKVFQGLGVSGVRLADLIISQAAYLSRDIEKWMLPSIAYLKTLLSSDEDVVRALRNSGWCFSCDVRKRMEPNISILHRCGLPHESVLKFMVRKPRLLMVKPDRLEEMIKKAYELGFQHGSGMLPQAVWVISSMNQGTWDAKFELLKSFGLNEEQIVLTFQKCPYFLSMSETKMKRALRFFMDELKFTPSDVAVNSNMMRLSMDKRIIPRLSLVKLLLSKELLKRSLSMSTILVMSENKFYKDYVLKYKDEDPDVFDLYERLRK